MSWQGWQWSLTGWFRRLGKYCHISTIHVHEVQILEWFLNVPPLQSCVVERDFDWLANSSLRLRYSFFKQFIRETSRVSVLRLAPRDPGTSNWVIFYPRCLNVGTTLMLWGYFLSIYHPDRLSTQPPLHVSILHWVCFCYASSLATGSLYSSCGWSEHLRLPHPSISQWWSYFRLANSFSVLLADVFFKLFWCCESFFRTNITESSCYKNLPNFVWSSNARFASLQPPCVVYCFNCYCCCCCLGVYS